MAWAHSKRRILVALATPIEASALREPLAFATEAPEPWIRYESGSGCDIVVTGVGKANAAGAVAATLDPDRHTGVLNVGIAGVLPSTQSRSENPAHNPAPGLGSSILATSSIFADDGVQQPDQFQSFSELGFAVCSSSDAIEPDPEWFRALAGLVDAQGPIATVSTCSGTDQLARQIRARTGAIAEACEGAACGLSAMRMNVRFCEIRVISNTTGDRASQRWDLASALARLQALIEKADLSTRLA